MPEGVILGKEHTALMFISTKSFSKDEEDGVIKIMDEDLGGSIQFVGMCFGKFDLIAEFCERSAKVASYKACNMQEKASKMLQEEYEKENPICSSLVLCNEFIKTDERKKLNAKELPVRFYSLFVPKKVPTNLGKVLKEVKENMRLLFSSSYFSFLLIISGSSFYEVFDEFSKFRENTKDFFLESSTYVAIDWKKEDKPSGMKKIEANLFLRVKEGFGDIDDIEIDEFVKSKNKRFGSFDLSLLVEDETLWKMKQKILGLRKKYKDMISHTSTSLLIERAQK